MLQCCSASDTDPVGPCPGLGDPPGPGTHFGATGPYSDRRGGVCAILHKYSILCTPCCPVLFSTRTTHWGCPGQHVGSCRPHQRRAVCTSQLPVIVLLTGALLFPSLIKSNAAANVFLPWTRRGRTHVRVFIFSL